jgi:NitT/TauT family transport system substrate-binding protein
MSKLSRILTKRPRYRQVAVLITVLAAVASAGCGSPAAAGSPSAEKPNLVIATVPTASSAGLYIAQQEGFFRQAGLNVKILSVDSAATVTSDLLNGSIDVLDGAYPGFIEAQVHGAGRFHILADGYAGAPNVDEIVVLPRSGITSGRQLAGQTIAVNALDSIAALLVSSTLESVGVPPSKVHLVAMPFPAMPAALKAHRIDAAYEAEPYLSEAEVQAGAENLIDVNGGATQNFAIDGYVATVRWCQRYPKTAAAVARAIDRGQALADTDRPLVQGVLQKYASISEQTAAIMALGDFPTDVDAAHLQRVPDLMQSFGQLNTRFNITAMTNPVGS